MPPVQAHADAMIFNDVDVTAIHVDTMDEAHSNKHHKNDTDE